LAAATGKLAFDSLVQRDAPDANYGRSFARFEARFQLTWVAGALVPVALRLPERVGFTLVGAAAAFAAVTYFLGTRAIDSPPVLVRPADQTLEMHDLDALRELAVDATVPFESASPVDPTHVMPGADEVRPSEPPVTPPPAVVAPPAWSDLPVEPVVSSVQGVEIDPDVGRRRDVPSAPAPRAPDAET
jgi:hypothetical protein